MLILSEKSGRLYEVDVLEGCSCPASRFRPWQQCKHQRALSEYYKRQVEAQKERKAA